MLDNTKPTKTGPTDEDFAAAALGSDEFDITLQARIDALNMQPRTVLIRALCDATRPSIDVDTLYNLACMTQRELVNVCLVECVDVPNVPSGK